MQYIHYMPYGELWKNQQRTPYNERFKFTGKERDEETGYDFFGARNYTSDASIWTSPDPLSDKYPQISSYAYCANNPMKYVDPDGREKHIFHPEKSAGMYTSINLPDDNGIYIFAHGSKKQYIQVLNKNQHLKNENITAEELSQYIQNHSKQWEDDEKNEDISMVFLYACHTGEGESSLAEELSSKLNEHDTYVVAPMGTLISKNSPNKIKNGKYKGVRDDFNNVLPWGVFKNGELITTIRGNKSPNTKTLKNRLYINQILETLKNHFIHDDK